MLRTSPARAGGTAGPKRTGSSSPRTVFFHSGTAATPRVSPLPAGGTAGPNRTGSSSPRTVFFHSGTAATLRVSPLPAGGLRGRNGPAPRPPGPLTPEIEADQHADARVLHVEVRLR